VIEENRRRKHVVPTPHSGIRDDDDDDEELDGRAVSALDVRSRKLSTGINGQS
jgi:hypothetical protein